MHVMRLWTSVAMLGILMLGAGCGFKADADAKFGDQHFKTAIALMELYRVRHGHYPESLTELDFTGDWDPIDGYELNLEVQRCQRARTGPHAFCDAQRRRHPA